MKNLIIKRITFKLLEEIKTLDLKGVETITIDSEGGSMIIADKISKLLYPYLSTKKIYLVKGISAGAYLFLKLVKKVKTVNLQKGCSLYFHHPNYTRLGHGLNLLFEYREELEDLLVNFLSLPKEAIGKKLIEGFCLPDETLKNCLIKSNPSNP